VRNEELNHKFTLDATTLP